MLTLLRLQLHGFFQPAHQDEAHCTEINAKLHLFRVNVLEFKTKQLSRQSERNLTAVQTRTRTHKFHAPGATLNARLSPPASVCCLDRRQCQECVSVSPRCQCPRKQAARAAGERGSNNNKHESAPPLLAEPPPPPPPSSFTICVRKAAGATAG